MMGWRGVIAGCCVVVIGLGAMAVPVDATAVDSTPACVPARLVVSQGYATSGIESYYGGTDWPEMSAALDGAAASVTVVPDLENLGQLLGFDALWIDQRDTTGQLTAAEAANVAAFIATGRRVVMIGENDTWRPWNEQLLGLVGGSAVPGVAPSYTLMATAVHELTAGVTVIQLLSPGVAVGGTSLFDQNSVTLWGDDTTVLTILDVNGMGQSWSFLDNAAFFTNVAAWIACAAPPLFEDDFEHGDLSAWSAVAP